MFGFVVCFDRNEFYPADLLVAPTQDLRKRDGAPEVSGMDEEEEDEEREYDEPEAPESGRQQRKCLPRGAAAKYDNPSVLLQFKHLSPSAHTSLHLLSLLICWYLLGNMDFFNSLIDFFLAQVILL